MDWTEINLPFGWDHSTSDSFAKRGLNKPGTLIEMEDGSTYLIGDINEMRGVCDDCTAFQNNEIVRRYKVVYAEESK